MGMALVWLPMHDFEIDVYKLASVQVLDSFMQMMNENSNVEVMLEFRKENPLCPTLALTSRTFDCSLLFVESKMTLLKPFIRAWWCRIYRAYYGRRTGFFGAGWRCSRGQIGGSPTGEQGSRFAPLQQLSYSLIML